MKRLPSSWLPRLGAALAAGSLGLLAGFVTTVAALVVNLAHHGLW